MAGGVGATLDAEGAVALLRDAFLDDEELRGLFLGGSRGRGDADAWSDLDFVALAEAANHAGVADRWLRAIADRAPVIHTMRNARGPALLLNVVTEAWLRIDLLLLPPPAFAFGRARDGVAVLFDRDDAASRLPPTLPPRSPDPARVRDLTLEFLRVMGLGPVVAGRDEWVVAATGTGLLRDMVRDLLVEESPVPDRGGALGLKRLLPPEDMRLLADLPYPPPERDAILAAHAAIARAFLPRARALHDRLGLEWPRAFEEATRRRLLETLGPGAADW